MAAPTNQSPKNRFLASEAQVHNHREMMETRAFETGTDMALMQYANDIASEVRDQPTALAVGFKLAGAVGFLNSLKTISEKPIVPASRPTDNLQHQA